jgi:hypothetical protein
MFKTNATGATVDNHYQNKDVGGGIAGTEIDADDGNITQDELTSAVEQAGLTLDPSGTDRDQIAEAMLLVGAGASSCFLTGGSGVSLYNLSMHNGAILAPSSYAKMYGFQVNFQNIYINTGTAQLNFEGLGTRDIYFNGAPLTGGEITLGEAYFIFNVSLNRWDYIHTGGVNNIADGSVSMAKLNNGATEGDNVRSRVFKAFCLFSGTAPTPAEIEALNVSSITDFGLGRYDVNMTVGLGSTYVCGVAGSVTTDLALHGDNSINNWIISSTKVGIQCWGGDTIKANWDQVFFWAMKP